MTIHSFGCSFVKGNGVDSKVERTLRGSVHVNAKGHEIDQLREFREKNSFTGQLSKLLKCDYRNFGKSGSNTNYLIDAINDELSKSNIKEGDLVIACFTSPLRNSPTFFPQFFKQRNPNGMFGLSFGINELDDTKANYPTISQEEASFRNTLLDYRRTFITKYFDYSHSFDYYSQNTVLLLQYVLDYYKINHIFIDAFDTFVTNDIYDKTEHIDKSKYWNYQKHSIWSFLNEYEDDSLFEDRSLTDTINNGKLHPSSAGNKIIAKELYSLYKTNYD